MKKNNLGNLAIALLVALNLFLWLFFTPPLKNLSLQNYASYKPETFYPMEILGEILSSSALILFACGLVLANKPRILEPYFGGLDKMYVTHKNIAILAIILIVGHELWVPKTGVLGPGLWLGQLAFAGILAVILLTVGPRVPFLSGLTRFTYRGWFQIHRWVGVFFIAAVGHLLMVEPPMLFHSPVLLTFVMLVAAVGIGAYLYKEFLWERLQPHITCRVESVRKLNGTTTEVVLKPQSRKFVYQAGQFLFVYFEGDILLAEPHPFTISSAPWQDNLHLSIKASGDWTGYLQTNLKPGTVAHVDGPYGGFNYKSGAAKQVWVAGGIGITPFLSWMRDFNGTSPQQIDFFYTVNVPAEALYLDEIEKAVNINKNFKPHISFSSQDGRLSAQKIVEASGETVGKEIYMCGPFGMVMAFRDAFVAQGVSAANVHYEEFNFR
jgi:predicted ferric reductase